MALKRRTKLRLGIVLILIVTTLFTVLAIPKEDSILKKIGIDKSLKVRRGLDLQGGAYLVYQADMSKLPAGSDASQVLENARTVIERRVNPGGTTEAVVQTATGNRIVVQLPGEKDPEAAKQTIGRTAQLSFTEVAGKKLTPTNVSGSDVAKAAVDFMPQTNQPVVSLQLKGGDSTKKFAELTTKLAANNHLLVTTLDQQIVFGPANVNEPITTGEAQLSGSFTVAQAREISTLLNAGALPVPVHIVAQQTIGPTLGALSIKQSVVAALVGLLSVCIFLVVYYRWAGVIAVGSLVFYSLLMLTVIKLSVFTPYVLVLTLAGVAGFILSVAVAVDANILILERMKEEIARGASPPASFETGFTYAWTSIRDANASTVISCLILYNFGASIIKGFALTLMIGVVLSLLTALTVSKLLLRVMVRSRFAKHSGWIGLPSGQADLPGRVKI